MKTAEEILNENLIGVNKETIKSHHDFKPSVLKAMEEYAEQFKGVSLTAEEQVLKAIKEGKTGEKFWKELKKIQEEGIFKDEDFTE